jgi:phosphoglycerate kinase
MIMLTLDSFDVRNKTVILRADLNSPFIKQKIVDNERLKASAVSIKELSRKKAKVVVLAHQGRFEDRNHLNQHAKLLEKHTKKKIKFVRDVIGKKAVNAIKSMKPGDIVLLDNVRLLKDEETPKKSRLVKTLTPLADLFVNDAFSVSHRNQASLAGFRIPSCFGRLMQKELESLEKARKPKGLCIYLLGGAKADDCMDIMNFILKKHVIVLLSGLTANVFLKAAGVQIGKGSEDLIRKKGYWKLINKAEKLLKHKKIILPADVVILNKGKKQTVNIDNIPKNATVLDIGNKTIEHYRKFIAIAGTIVIKGPAGLYEDRRFRKGTEAIFRAISRSKAFTIVGGGDTNEALDILKIRRSMFSHVSLGGGALISYLSGKPMPGIDAVMSG